MYFTKFLGLFLGALPLASAVMFPSDALMPGQRQGGVHQTAGKGTFNRKDVQSGAIRLAALEMIQRGDLAGIKALCACDDATCQQVFGTMGDNGFLLIHLAVVAGNYPLAQVISERLPDEDLWLRYTADQKTVLHLAAGFGDHQFIASMHSDNPQLCEALLNLPTKGGRLPIHLAALEGHDQTVRVIDTLFPFQRFAYRLLLDGSNILHLAMWKNRANFIRSVFNLNKDLAKDLLGMPNHEGVYPLLMACVNGCKEICDHVLYYFPEETFFEDCLKDGVPLFCVLAQYKKNEAIYYICMKNRKLGLKLLNRSDRFGTLPIHCAARGGNCEMIEFCQRQFPDEKFLTRLTANHSNMLHFAAHCNQLSVIQKVYSLSRADCRWALREPNFNHHLPIHSVVGGGGNYFDTAWGIHELFKEENFFLAQTSDINGLRFVDLVINNYRNDILKAFLKKDRATFEFILNQPGPYGRLPIHHCALVGAVESAEFLVHAFPEQHFLARILTTGMTVRDLAQNNNKEVFVQYLDEKKEKSLEREREISSLWNPLHVAASRGDVACLKAFLQGDRSDTLRLLNAPGKQGILPIHMAAIFQQRNFIDFLGRAFPEEQFFSRLLPGGFGIEDIFGNEVWVEMVGNINERPCLDGLLVLDEEVRLAQQEESFVQREPEKSQPRQETLLVEPISHAKSVLLDDPGCGWCNVSLKESTVVPGFQAKLRTKASLRRSSLKCVTKRVKPSVGKSRGNVSGAQ
jgi:ankyrin repeat protein